MQAVADMVTAVCEKYAGTEHDNMLVDGAICGSCTVADIGCDHAFVSIYLRLNSIAERVIALDVRKGPLDIARANIASYGLAGYIDVRLSDGFEALKPKEADAAVIAGMGGLLMVDILRRGRIHTDNGIDLILQPQSETDKLRQYLYDIGYDIEDECFLQDEGKYYTVIRAAKRQNTGTFYEKASETADNGECVSDIKRKAQLLYGPVLLKKKDSILRGYIEERLVKNRELRDRLLTSSTPRSMSRIEELKVEEEIMLCALREIEVNRICFPVI
jgi:tRNA (adenine22-N1)-methyltransferase